MTRFFNLLYAISPRIAGGPQLTLVFVYKLAYTSRSVAIWFVGCKMSKSGPNISNNRQILPDILLKFANILPDFPHFSLRQTKWLQALAQLMKGDQIIDNTFLSKKEVLHV